MTIELVDPQGTIMREIADPALKRDDVALTYAFALRQNADMNWPAVNHAIIDRWSMSALKYVKDKAWAMLCAPHLDAAERIAEDTRQRSA